ncbi:MAG: hypothetical protein A3G32_05775 [Deltaproteobacteria bacterium RIFCSPLOWO2_12_FULL_40_28]|nr:MAG: hypothetical protein A3C45_03945 [Deltaproteobacteria bacterium RIFCSPHIGHO2_02_FULL_40_28]OGQ19018.1 MAG: hypothetical protein A3E27_09775 [Deltaproteobacteria bacterium RIFCSPHIGHO2_12_FULL_40_32]OGQ39561.1 MAG: hypothetical protein A3I69_09890 [Deltaproteobacteria bacterium RIFCSPLOWO2_02_FULL_40_36]OGQ53451.1 MAG: hypothetical protein A3G32_05775 [Deltaproteobacteria bacterium RIFCSPLOWO2_12_FULL_40_28]
MKKDLLKLLQAKDDYISSDKMHEILKKRDPLIGTPGGTIQAYRYREEMTQKDLAKKTGIRQSHISEMERNKRTIGLQVAKKLAKALNCNYRRLV